MHLGLREGCRHSEDHTLSIVPAYADGGEDCAVLHGAANTNFDVSSIDYKVGDLGQWSCAPEFKSLVEFSSQSGDLSGAHFGSAQLLHHFGHAPGGDALQVHLGDGDFE